MARDLKGWMIAACFFLVGSSLQIKTSLVFDEGWRMKRQHHNTCLSACFYLLRMRFHSFEISNSYYQQNTHNTVVQWLPLLPRSKKAAAWDLCGFSESREVNWELYTSVRVCKSANWHLVQGVFLPSPFSSWERLQRRPPLPWFQEEAGMENGWMDFNRNASKTRTLAIWWRTWPWKVHCLVFWFISIILVVYFQP